MNAAAVFDLDGTLLEGTSSEKLLLRYLLRRRQLHALGLGLALARAATAIVRGRSWAIRRNKLYLRAVSVTALGALLDDFVRKEIGPRLNADALARLERLRSSGHRILLLSGAPHFIVDAVVEYLDADGGVGTRIGTRGGAYDGRVLGTHYFGRGKVLGLEALVREHGIDPARSTAFADHGADVEVLEHFGTAVAVKPRHALRLVAARRGWEVLD